MIPFIEFPTIEQIRQARNEIPQYTKVIEILEKESKNGNVILNIGDAGTLPDNTHINIQLREEPSEEYTDLKDYGTPYKRLSFNDNQGVVCIWFGVKK